MTNDITFQNDFFFVNFSDVLIVILLFGAETNPTIKDHKNLSSRSWIINGVTNSTLFYTFRWYWRPKFTAVKFPYVKVSLTQYLKCCQLNHDSHGLSTRFFFFFWIAQYLVSRYSNINKKLLPRIRTFREITFFMLYLTRIFKSNFNSLRLVIINWEIQCASPTKYAARNQNWL
jgi:hypothetical protein